MGEHTSKHDTFLRSILGNQQIALDYFRSCLPAQVLDKLDFSTLRQLPDSYISKELQKSISDIVYACRRADGFGEVKISLLIEHKSYIDKYTPIQIGSYIFSGLLKQIADGEKPSLIIPILLYHGKAKREYKTLTSLFEELEPELLRFVPDYQYVFNNLGTIPDEQIQATSLPTQIKETVMNTLDVFIEKGRKEGSQEKTKNAVRNLIKQSLLTDEQIASALEVTVKYVADIRRQI